MANPTLLTMPLCVNADKNTIPPTDAGTSGLFSEELGFQDINSLPLASGGKAPNRRDFNGVFALLGGIAYACQRGYTFEWDSTQDYVVGCVVLDTNDNKRYECISDVTANATPPSSDTTHWKEFGIDTTVLANTDLSNLTATGESKFTGRADTSLSNLDNNGKKVLMDYNSPDYDNGIQWSYPTARVEKSYVAPSDGWVAYTLTGGAGYEDGKIKINSNTVIDASSASTAYNATFSGIVRVQKNDTIYVTSTYTDTNATGLLTRLIFYPNKEVIV